MSANNDEIRSYIVSRAHSIYYLGSGTVLEEYAEDVLKELDRYTGVYYYSIEQNGVTVIEKSDN